MEDYYSTLGVAPDASLQNIKKAYRKLARKYQPLGPGQFHTPEAKEKFMKVAEAFFILNHEHRRKEYDAYLNNRPQDSGPQADWVLANYVYAVQNYTTEEIWDYVPKDAPGIFTAIKYRLKIFAILFYALDCYLIHKAWGDVVHFGRMLAVLSFGLIVIIFSETFEFMSSGRFYRQGAPAKVWQLLGWAILIVFLFAALTTEFLVS